MFGAVLAAIFLVIVVLAVKDMNDKLTVMTASNTGYQKMIDSQADKLKALSDQLKDAKQGHQWDIESFQRKEADSKAKMLKSEQKMTENQVELTRTKNELAALQKTHQAELQQADDHIDRLQRANQDLQHAKDAREAELREQIRTLSQDNARCKSQYEALFKQHLQNTDTIQALKSHMEERDGESTTQGAIVPRVSSAKPVEVRQLQMPNNNVPRAPAVLQPPIVSKQSSSPSTSQHVLNGHSEALEEPHHAGPPVFSAQVPKLNPPVAAEPPVARHNPEFAPLVHQNADETGVMEAPRNVHQFQRQFHQRPLQQPRQIIYGRVKQPKGINLDQEVDHDQQDHPGLPGPLDTGRLDHGYVQQEEENDADDAVDGRIISNQEDKVVFAINSVANFQFTNFFPFFSIIPTTIKWTRSRCLVSTAKTTTETSLEPKIP